MTDAIPVGPTSVIVGQVIGVHGLRGEVRAKVLSDVPHRFSEGQSLYIRGNPCTIISSNRISSQLVILKFHGVDSLEAAQDLVGQGITIPQTSVPNLPEGEYFHFQLLGLKVITEEGEELGLISEILETGSNDVYVVSAGSGEILVPALAEVVCDVRLDQGTMLVRLPEGLR